MCPSSRGDSPTTGSGARRREAVVDLLSSFKRALHANEIAERLGVAPSRYPKLQRLLEELSLEGSIVALPGQRFRLSQRQVEGRGAEHEGTLSVNPRGFGFVSLGGAAEDVYVPPESMGGALHGDTVAVRIATRSRRGVEGEVVRVIKRRHARVAGVLRRRGKSAWLEPDDVRVRGPIVVVPREPGGPLGPADAEDGAAAVVTITRFPALPEENPEGVVEAVLGMPGDPNVEVAKILVREGIEEEHPAEAIAEAEAFGDDVPAEALAGRTDLTHLPMPTIDPEDARDHDDAVWVVREEDGSYRAWIAIADVSHYVQPGSALDQAALARANSIYLPDRAIPMLPRALSSNLCSLLPGVIRLCLCVEVELDPAATVKRARVVEGYIRSIAKLTYPGVARALGLTAEPPRSPEAEALRNDLQVMWDLARLLRGKRMRRGALDLELPEAKVVLDPETGAPLDVQKRSHDPGVAKAYQLIEELMLLANETCAQFVVDQSIPTVFRYHAPPDQAKLERFATMCAELGLAFDPEDATEPKRLSVFLKKLHAHPQKQVLHMLLLRAMKQAVYDVANVGHFGLASSAYLHFTSPIRRYPDITAHRAIRAVLRGERIDRSEAALERLREAAITASERERKAMEVEREVVDLHRAIVMRSRLGDLFEGTVTGIVGTGVYVNIEDPFVDVLVRMESLGPDQYEIDDEGLRVIGVRSGDRIAIGDSMLVQIEDVAILRRTVYARRLAGEGESSEARPRRLRRGEADARAKRRVKTTKSTLDAKGGRGARGGKSKQGGKSTKARKKQR
ncbi:ribonuclease R [Sorangium cellulosum]|uniref:Ribonuclease R n=1 Tax=Sorangium cellulosum TaxID=56 RepID=A0A4P2QDT3_SORCE|nr:ribonuclease R [Sorangium cellulosum]AUX27568.1 ribonuclease R [Sorangium cellulosum]